SDSSGVRTRLFSARVVNTLNGTINVTFANTIPCDKVATFFYVTDLVSPSRQDQGSTKVGNDTNPTSDTTPPTSQPDELLVGALAYNNRTGGITPTGGFNALG